MDVRIGWAEFDAEATPYQVNVGWAQFDATGIPFNVCVGWAQFDCQVPVPTSVKKPATLFYAPGQMAYKESQKIEIPITADDEEDEEAVIITLMMELAKYAFL